MQHAVWSLLQPCCDRCKKACKNNHFSQHLTTTVSGAPMTAVADRLERQHPKCQRVLVSNSRIAVRHQRQPATIEILACGRARPQILNGKQVLTMNSDHQNMKKNLHVTMCEGFVTAVGWNDKTRTL
jgi:hypothetical protein